MSGLERRNLYARVFGFPGGDAAQTTINRDFSDIWLRFISAVSSFVRQVGVDELLRSSIPFGVSMELVRKAGRDLAAQFARVGDTVLISASVWAEVNVIYGTVQPRGGAGSRWRKNSVPSYPGVKHTVKGWALFLWYC